nr:porin [uncultured Celeribacter sp.]
MKTRSFLIATTALTVFASAAAAETNYIYGNLGYTNYDADEVDLDQFEITGAYEGSVNGFTYGVAFDNDSTEVEDQSLNLDTTTLSLGYDITPDFTVLGMYRRESLDDDTMKTTVLGGEYRFNDFTFGLSGVQFDMGTDLSGAFAFAEYDNGPMNAYLSYTALDQDDIGDVDIAEIGASYETDLFEISASYEDFDIGELGSMDITSLSGKYYFNDFRILAGYTKLGGMDDDDLNIYKVGGGYKVAENTWLDAHIGKVDSDEDDLDFVGLELTYELGDRKLRTVEYIPSYFDINADLPLIREIR